MWSSAAGQCIPVCGNHTEYRAPGRARSARMDRSARSLPRSIPGNCRGPDRHGCVEAAGREVSQATARLTRRSVQDLGTSQVQPRGSTFHNSREVPAEPQLDYCHKRGVLDYGVYAQPIKRRNTAWRKRPLAVRSTNSSSQQRSGLTHTHSFIFSALKPVAAFRELGNGLAFHWLDETRARSGITEHTLHHANIPPMMDAAALSGVVRNGTRF